MAATWYTVTVEGDVMRWAHKPTLSEMQATVGGYVEHVALDSWSGWSSTHALPKRREHEWQQQGLSARGV